MSAPEVTELLERGAATPSSMADVDEIRARVQIRRRRRRFALGAAVAAVVVAVVGGALLGASLFRDPPMPFVDDEPAPASSSAIVLPTIPTREGEGGDLAAAHGRLRFDPDDRCFYLDQGGTRTSVAWPRGWYAEDDPPRLIDAGGTTRLHVGDRVELGGGYGQTYEGREPCPGSDGWFFAWQVNERGN
ncbi:MAG: FHA domain-containing protein [Actinobacteria bacterium]|nr:FHA domain-containing protein [Actinomycetota bacterium]